MQFSNLRKDILAIQEMLKEQTSQTDKQFARLDLEVASLKKEVAELKEENARYKVIWGIGATLGASLVAFVLNKIF